MSNEETLPKAEGPTPVRVATLMESLPGIVKQRVTVLQDLQKQHDELEKKFREERSALIAKYQQLYEPLYSKRSDIVNGEEETANEANGTPDAKEATRGVPDFWLNAMKSNEILAMQITPKDEDALKHLKDIRSVYTDEPKGFKLEFYFAENPYFTNSLLVKEYHMVDEDEPILERAVGTEINWKPGKNLTMKLMKRKPKKGAPKDAPLQTKMQACESFFNFFNPPRIPDDGEVMDQDEAEELEDVMEQDYDVGATIRDKIIAHAVSWFTGEAAEDDDDEGEELFLEDASSDGDEDEEEDDDEDEEDEEEEPKGEGAPKQ